MRSRQVCSLYSPESIDRLGSHFARTSSVSLLTLFTLDTNLTKSDFSQTRYTDSVLASLEPRLFHSKWLNTLKLILLFLNSYGRSCFLNSKPIIINDCTFTFKYNVEFLSASYSCSRFYIFKILLFLFLFFSDLSNWNNFILLEQFYSFGITLFFWNNFILLE